MRLCDLGGIEKFRFVFLVGVLQLLTKGHLAAFSTDATGQLNVLGHDRHTLGVNGAQVGVFEQTNEVGFRGFLQSEDGRSLETKIALEVLGNLTHQTLEGQLADEEVGGLLVATDLTQSDGSRAVAVAVVWEKANESGVSERAETTAKLQWNREIDSRLLDTSRGRGTLASRLGGELLARSLASGGFASGLLGTSHVDDFRLLTVVFCGRLLLCGRSAK